MVYFNSTLTYRAILGFFMYYGRFVHFESFLMEIYCTEFVPIDLEILPSLQMWPVLGAVSLCRWGAKTVLRENSTPLLVGYQKSTL